MSSTPREPGLLVSKALFSADCRAGNVRRCSATTGRTSAARHASNKGSSSPVERSWILLISGLPNRRRQPNSVCSHAGFQRGESSGRAEIIVSVLLSASIDAVASGATALGTLVLAIATYVMAAKTGDLAASSRRAACTADHQLEILKDQTEEVARQSRAAEEALNASVRPLIVDVPFGTGLRVPVGPVPPGGFVRPDPATLAEPEKFDVATITHTIEKLDKASLNVPIRNIGLGVALLAKTTVTVASGGWPVVSGLTGSTVLAPTEMNYLMFRSVTEHEEGALATMLAGEHHLVAEVVYTDISGRQESRTRLQLGKLDTGRYQVSDVQASRPSGSG